MIYLPYLKDVGLTSTFYDRPVMVSGIKLIMSEAQNAIEAAQEIVTEVSPAPVEFKNVTPATEIGRASCRERV